MNLMEIAQKREKEYKKIATFIYERAIALHNGALLGIVPLWHKMPNCKELIKLSRE